jgi:O-antigen ligase
LGILLVTSGIGFADRLPELHVGITLQIPDVLLLGSLAFIVVRWLCVRESRILHTPLDRPLLVFYGVTLFSTLAALVRSSVAEYQAINGIRIFSYYLTFFVVTNLIRDRRQLVFLLNGLLLLATIVAVAMLAQYVLGGAVQLLQNNQEPEDIRLGAAARIAPPGFSLVMVSFLMVFCRLVCERFTPASLLRLCHWGLLAGAVVLTFFRSYWIALLLVLLLVPVLVRRDDRRRLLGWGTLLTMPAVFTLVVVLTVPDFPLSSLVRVAWERLGTATNVGAYQGQDPNYDYRRLENEYAFPAIEARPVIGYGLGAPYRPLDPLIDWRDEAGLHDRTNQIHNGHLGVLLLSGLIGYGSLLWFSMAFLLRGFTLWRRVPDDRLKAVVLSFSLMYLALLVAAGANSVFTQWYWVPVIGMMMGINEVILGKAESDNGGAAAPSGARVMPRNSVRGWTRVQRPREVIE